MREHSYWVYVMASRLCGYLYVGMTNDLVRRVEEHRAGLVDSHSRKHAINRLVWFELHQYVDQAILREKRIKRWRRPWKFRLIEESNPRWLDLYGSLVADRLPGTRANDAAIVPDNRFGACGMTNRSGVGLAEWVGLVDAAMKRDWCISTAEVGLSDEELTRLWRDGEEPEAFAAWFAEKYDLIRFEQQR